MSGNDTDPMGMDPTRPHQWRPADYAFVGATVLAGIVLLLWVFFGSVMDDPEAYGEVDVRFLQPYQATKVYLCPNCNREIPPGLATTPSFRSTPPTCDVTAPRAGTAARRAEPERNAADRSQPHDHLTQATIAGRQDNADAITTVAPPTIVIVEAGLTTTESALAASAPIGRPPIKPVIKPMTRPIISAPSTPSTVRWLVIATPALTPHRNMMTIAIVNPWRLSAPTPPSPTPISTAMFQP